MTDQQLCPLCPEDRAKPLYDGGYVCRGCAEDTGRQLERLAAAAGEAMATVAKQSRTGRASGLAPRPVDAEPEPKSAGALVSTPLPVNLDAGRRYDAAVNEMVTLVRMVAEERGQDVPAVRTGWCGHTSCAARRQGLIYGPRCADQPPEHPVAVMASWLRGQLEWLRHHPDGEVAMRNLRRACRTLENVIDRPADMLIVGRCACETFLYARKGSKAVRCQGCGTEYDVDACRAGLQDALAESLCTGAELADLATYLGHRATREATRKLIKVWANRKLITAHGEYRGDPLYQFGEVMTRLMARAGG